jgi:S-DNA-T family DNA segregation ATPase FtsK/SpoIIIE
VPAHRPPGRALVGEDGLECQLAVPRAHGAALTAPARPGRAPLTIPELPSDPVLPLGTRAPAADAAAALLLAVGPGGDEGHPIAVDLRRTGGLLLAGPPGSGRTTALDAFAADLAHRGAQVLRFGGRPADGPGRSSPPTAGDGAPGAAALEAWLRGLRDAPGVLLLDDVPAPAESPVLEALSRPGVRVALVAAGQAADLASHYQGPIAALRRSRTGLLLQPGPGDADLLGVRLPRVPVPERPGSGWLVDRGSVHRVQVARRSAAVATGPR